MNSENNGAAYEHAFDLARNFQQAFGFFNQKLFAGKLSSVIITTQRHRGASGFFSPDSYQERAFDEGGLPTAPGFTVHEIAIMPDAMYGRTDREVLSTLVHEMCHQLQQEQGHPSRNNYHNREWAKYMREVGLEPSDQGKYDVRNPDLTDEERKNAVEGKSTGQKMSHFIMPGGLFDKACAELLEAGFVLRLQQAPILRLKPPKSKLKYTCPDCGLRAWAKPGSRLACADCKCIMDCEESEED